MSYLRRVFDAYWKWPGAGNTKEELLDKLLEAIIEELEARKRGTND